MQNKRLIHSLVQDPGPNSLLNTSNPLIQISLKAGSWKREQRGTVLLGWGRGCGNIKVQLFFCTSIMVFCWSQGGLRK